MTNYAAKTKLKSHEYSINIGRPQFILPAKNKGRLFLALLYCIRSSRLGLGVRLTTPPHKKILLRDLKRRPRPTQGCRAYDDDDHDDDDHDDDDDDVLYPPCSKHLV
jgi:hypothetical protein